MTPSETAAQLIELMRAAHSSEPDDRRQRALVAAVNAIYDPDAFIALGNAIQAEPEPLRITAAHILGDAGNSDALDALDPLLQDQSGRVRLRAVLAIERLGGAADDMAPALAGLIASDPNPQVRAAAARSLGMVRTPVADRALRAALSDRDAEVRAAAKATCGFFKRTP
jgi:HEAT repeat protein